MKETKLLPNSDKIHTTALGMERIKRNLCLEVDDIVGWCKQKIADKNSSVVRTGKNLYVNTEDYTITIHANSYTIITAHKNNKK